MLIRSRAARIPAPQGNSRTRYSTNDARPRHRRAAVRYSSTRWLLSLLHLLHLLRVCLLHLLRLLLVLLLHLLRSRFISLLFRQLLMFLVLLLLEFCRSWFCLATSFSCCCWYFWSCFAFPVFGRGRRRAAGP